MKRNPLNLVRMNALVTGGGTGIGRAIALALAQRGARLAITGRRREPLQAVVAEITAQGGHAIWAQADLTQSADIDTLLTQTIEQLGDIELLVCNAGELLGGAFARHSQAEIEHILNLNLLAPIELVRRLRPSLKAVVLVSSQAGQIPLPYFALYCATKAGLIVLGESLRYEFEGVPILIAAPPATRTAMTARLAAATEFSWTPMLTAEAVGQRIVKALVAGRTTVSFHLFYDFPVYLQRWFPGLVTKVLRWQRRRFAQIFAA